MPVNLSQNVFGLIPEFANNENNRPGILLMEFFEVAVTIGTNEGDVEVPTQLDDCKGVINLCSSSVFAAGDKLLDMTTDGVITTGAVTVRVSTVSIADGALTIRGFLVGTKRTTTVLLNDPE